MVDIVKSRELKKGILVNLSDWCLDPMGGLVNANNFKERTYKDFDVYGFRFCQDDEVNPNGRTEPDAEADHFTFTFEDYQGIKEAMISEIKHHPQDGKIEKEGKLTVVRHKSGRKHGNTENNGSPVDGYISGFKEEEWQVVKNALKSEKSSSRALTYLFFMIFVVGVMAVLIAYTTISKVYSLLRATNKARRFPR